MFKSKGEEHIVSAPEPYKKWCFSMFGCLLWY